MASQELTARPGGRARVTVAVFVAALFALVSAFPGQAGAARDLDIGFVDPLFGSITDGPMWTQAADDVGAGVIRVNVRWATVTNGQPTDPTNPADPKYDFSAVDRAVINARARGLAVLLTPYYAPQFAEGKNPPKRNCVQEGCGNWKVSAAELGKFATALATRYSGTFDGLPPVQMISSWIEPNISRYLRPQWTGRNNKPAGARRFRKMHNAVYDAVKAVSPAITVFTAGTAPFGDDPGGKRIRPMDFWRDVMCMKPNLKPQRKCVGKAGRIRFDVLSHHPIGINIRGRPLPPDRVVGHKDEIVVANINRLFKLLRAAERRNQLGTPGRHELWTDELWWQTKPHRRGVSQKKQAAFMAEALYLLWKQRVEGAVFLRLVDQKTSSGAGNFEEYLTGIFTSAGKRKASHAVIRFPFVTERRGKKLLVWGKAPVGGSAKIQMRKGSKGKFKNIAGLSAKEGEVFTTKVTGVPSGALQIRAKIGTTTSPVWRQGRG